MNSDTPVRLIRRAAAVATLAAAVPAVLGPGVAAGAAARPSPAGAAGPKPTVVFVHGAWADASGWDAVIKRLQRDGYPVLATANPLRGVASDAAYLGSILDTITGPVVLVGHSYGGFVITNAAFNRPNVKALVYIAAFIPDQGEDALTLISQHPGSQIVPPGLPGATTIARPFPLPGGGTGIDVYLDPAKFRQIFAADVDAAAAAVMAATQRPISAAAFEEPSGSAAWKTIPSWALVGLRDNVIGTANVRAMAQRAAGAGTVEVAASHVVMISEPGAVTRLIVDAARATS